MSLFGSKKKKPTGGNLEQDGLDVEMYHIVSLIKGTSASEINEIEKLLFGKTFNDMLEEGYRPSIEIKDDEGASWTASGKV